MKPLFLFTLFAIQLISSASAQQTPPPTRLNGSYILFATNAHTPLNKLIIRGEKTLKFGAELFQEKERYFLIETPPGRYRFDIVELRDGTFFDLGQGDKSLWQTDVKENTISYVGHLELTPGLAHPILSNKSSFALEFLQENHSDLLTSHKLHFGGVGEDDFFDVISE